MSTELPYLEKRAALTPYLWSIAVLAPLLCLAIAVVGGRWVSPWFPIVFGVVGFFYLANGITGLLRFRRAGIRIDEHAVTIGRVTGRPAQRVLPLFQSRGAFVAPWPAVQAVSVITDPTRLAQLRSMYKRINRSAPRRAVRDPYGLNKGMGVGVGQFWLPRTKAILLIRIDPTQTDLVSMPSYRDRRGQGVLDVGLWLIPTAHPDRLRAVLADLRRSGIRVEDVPLLDLA